MRLWLQMQKSTPTSDKSLESAVSAEVRTPPDHRESKRTRECRERTFRSDRKFARRCNHFVVIAARAALHAHGDHPVGQTRSIRLDTLLHTQGRVRSSGDRNKMC